MYLEHYGLNEAPFRIAPHTDFFFAGANRGATLEALIYAVVHGEGIVKIIGEVGSGKTMLCRVLMERLPESVVVVHLANPSLSRDDILYALAEELGFAVPENARTGSVMRALQEALVRLHGEGKQVAVLIDEAHAMPMEILEEIRLLSNLESNRHKLLKLVLFGQPELEDTLLRAAMRQLRERITHSFTLDPLLREDIAQYLEFRMRAAGYRGPSPFTSSAIRLIDEASQGLMRRINILADKALLAAYAAGTHRVDVKEARVAIRDADFAGLRAARSHPILPAGLFWAAGGAAAMLAGVLAWQSLGGGMAGEAPAAAPPGVEAPPAPTVRPGEHGMPVAPAAAEASPPPRAANTPLSPPPPAASAASGAPTLAKLLADSRPWIESVPDERWFIQLYTTADDRHPERVETFLQQAVAMGLELSALRGYHSDLGGARRYGVIYGDFATSAEANRALETLPEALKRYRPYVRQAVRLKPPRNAAGSQ